MLPQTHKLYNSVYFVWGIFQRFCCKLVCVCVCENASKRVCRSTQTFQRSEEHLISDSGVWWYVGPLPRVVKAKPSYIASSVNHPLLLSQLLQCLTGGEKLVVVKQENISETASYSR